MHHFGGVAKFARLFGENFRAAPKGSRRSLDLMLAYIHMVEASEAIRQPSPDYSQLSDEELNRLITASLSADAERAQAVAGVGG